MRALSKKALADIKSRPLQSSLIALLIASASAALTLAISTQTSLSNPWERTFEASNGAHVWLYGNAGVDLTVVGAEGGVTGSSGPFPLTWRGRLIAGERSYHPTMQRMAELPRVSTPLLTAGRWLTPGRDDEVVIDHNLARDWGLEVGQEVGFLNDEEEVALEVVGLVVDTGKGPYPRFNPVAVYVSPEAFARFEPEAENLPTLYGVQLENPEASAAFFRHAAAVLPDGALSWSYDWETLRDTTSFAAQFSVVFLGVFSLFTLLAVCLIVANAVGGAVLGQSREIGLLKAVGFTPAQVTALFLLEYLGLGLLAGLAGLLMGVLLTPLLLRPVAEVLAASPAPDYHAGLLAAILAGILGVVALFTFLPARRGGRVGTAQAITAGFAAAQARPSRWGRLARRLGLSPVVVLGVNDAFARPARAALTVMGLALSVLTVTFALSLDASITNFSHTPGLAGATYDVGVFGGELGDEEVIAVLAAHDDIASFHTLRSLGATVEGEGLSVQARVLGGDYGEAGYIVQEGRMFESPGEAVVGLGLMQRLGLRIGDELPLIVNDQPLSLTVVGRYLEINNTGRMAMFSLETLRGLYPEATPGFYALKLRPGADPEALEASLLAAPGGLEVILASSGEAIPEADELRLVMFGLAALLLVIGLINLFYTSLLGVRERLRDFGIFKTLGLTPGQIGASVLTGAGLLALIATLIGVPLGLLVSRVLFDYGGRQFGIGTGLGVWPAWIWLLLLALGAVSVAALASAFPARLAARLRVTEVLRYE